MQKIKQKPLVKKSNIHYKIDLYIAFAVSIQSLLIILQQVLLDVAHMAEHTATYIRVSLTAGVMIPAIVLSAYRKPLLFGCTYIAVFILLSFTIIFYPINAEYIYGEATRFLLPVSIPCCLCLITIHDFSIFERMLYKISIATFALVIIYCVAYYAGVFYIDKYNMSFSYGCLIPMTFLYSKNRLWSRIFAFILLIIVVAIGSRGAAMVFIGYIAINAVFFDRKKLPFLISLGIIVVITIPFFISFLDRININSRLLSLLLEGEGISYDSGRSELYDMFISRILTQPWGHGLYGDRVILDGSYCHNFFIEIFYDFGFIGGFCICTGLFGWMVSVYLKVNKPYKQKILQFFIIIFIPLMVSGSFLKDYNFGLLLGIIILLKKENTIANFKLKIR